MEKYWDYEIEKDYGEELGLEFGGGIMDKAKRCSNKCMFCFIDQNPKGMRESLYFRKMMISRLSFLQGNFVTLTNMREDRYRIELLNSKGDKPYKYFSAYNKSRTRE